MITKEFAEHFAREWIESWNTHDLDRILSHYTDDFEMSSPVITKITDEASGTLKGKNKIGAYWAKALQLNPGLHFDLITILFGVNSITPRCQGSCRLSEMESGVGWGRKVDYRDEGLFSRT